MNEQEMLDIVRNSLPHEDEATPFNVATFFLRLSQKSRRTVAVFLSSGIKLVGRVLAFDQESILFTGQGDDSVDAAQLIILRNIASIRPVGDEGREPRDVSNREPRASEPSRQSRIPR